MKKTVFVSGFIPADLSALLQEYAKKEEIPVSMVLRKALKNYLSKIVALHNKSKSGNK